MPTTSMSERIVLFDALGDLVRVAFLNDTGGLRTAITGLVGNTRTIKQASDGSWPTITRRSWLEYRWVARYDASVLPTIAQGAAPGDEFAGADVAYLPDTLT